MYMSSSSFVLEGLCGFIPFSPFRPLHANSQIYWLILNKPLIVYQPPLKREPPPSKVEQVCVVKSRFVW